MKLPKLLPLLGPAPLVGPLVGPLALALLSGCASVDKSTSVDDHWTSDSLSSRVTYHMLGYEPDRDGEYIEFQYERKRDINLTVLRHFMNRNPENPFQEELEWWHDPRPPHSIVPYPHKYIHWEGLIMGGLIYGATGAFVPLPLDSLIATETEQGRKEFWEGVNYSLYPARELTTSVLHDALGIPTLEERGAAPEAREVSTQE